MTLMFAALIALQVDDVRRARDLIDQLNATELARREDAERALRRLAPESAEIDRLVDEACGAKAPEVAARAQSVRKFRAAARIVPDPEEFVERLASGNREIRWRAVERLRAIGPRAAPLAVDLAQDADINLRLRAIDILASTGDARYIEAVRASLGQANIETYVLQRLAMLGDQSIRPRLRELISAPERRQYDLIDALGRLRNAEDVPFFRSLLRDDNRDIAERAVTAISGWTAAKTALAAELHRLAADRMWKAILLSADVPQPGLQATLRECVKDSPVLPSSAFALAWMGDREALPYLMHCVRYDLFADAGIVGLARLRAKDAVWLLARAAGTPERESLADVLAETRIVQQDTAHWRVEVRRPDRIRDLALSAWALGEIGGDEAEGVLLQFLSSPYESVRYEACSSLGRLKSRRAVARLATLVDDAIAFRRTPPPDATAAYEAWLQAVQPAPGAWAQVREAAAAALAAITDQAPRGTVDEQAQFWKEWWKTNQSRFPK